MRKTKKKKIEDMSMDELIAHAKKLEGMYNLSSQHNTELVKEIQSYSRQYWEVRRKEEIRDKWRQSCDAFHMGINRCLGGMPTPLAARLAFDADDWARLIEIEAMTKQALEQLSALHATGIFIDDAGLCGEETPTMRESAKALLRTGIC
jgi:hypothetical protein